MAPSLTLAAAAIVGVLLDRLLGELRRFHPLVGFGRLAGVAERALRRGAPGHAIGNRLRGLLAWGLLVAPFVVLAWLAESMSSLGWMADALLLWLALGGRSLAEHAQAVAAPLSTGDLAAARERVGLIVSRDTMQLDADGVATATVESVLENGNDAVFGTLFWFFVFGGAGAVLYRLANTLDAMWGYRDERRIYFGWAAARLDDLLNFIPARLTALTYALLGRAGNIGSAFACWRAQAGAWPSPNAGPVMAAGAGALGVQLGGPAVYHGRVEERPYLGAGPSQAEVRPPVGGSEPGLRAWGANNLGAGDTPTAADIGRAVALVQRGQWLWLALFAAGSLAIA
ncbi:MAG: adenosylcobinamide-phosphate synthase CbiB [Sulfurisoma sp.]|nr:adenosylcobinamide-phosphate synthase CbiB [Sulfurisoma sp.]